MRDSEAEKETVSVSSLASVYPVWVGGWTEGRAETRGRRIAVAPMGIGERKMRQGGPGNYPERDDAQEERTDGMEGPARRRPGCLADGRPHPGCAGSS